jgi:hypothetical protein
MIAGCRPGFNKLIFSNDDSTNGEDIGESMGYFASCMPGAYYETNRY